MGIFQHYSISTSFYRKCINTCYKVMSWCIVKWSLRISVKLNLQIWTDLGSYQSPYFPLAASTCNKHSLYRLVISGKLHARGGKNKRTPSLPGRKLIQIAKCNVVFFTNTIQCKVEFITLSILYCRCLNDVRKVCGIWSNWT